MKLIKYIVLFLFCAIQYLNAQQQTVYTSFLLHPYLYNSAYAGVVPGTQFNLGYRNQWVGFDGAPKTLIFSGWGNFKKRPHMAAGGLVVSDRTGLIQRTSFQGSYAYQLKVNKKVSISFGLAFGGVQYNVKMYNAQPYDQDDVFMNSEILRAFAFDANAGFHLYSKNLFVGASNQQMLNSKIRWPNTNGRLTPHYYIYAGYNIQLDKKREWILQPSFLLRTTSPVPLQTEYYLKVLYKDIMWIGGAYRQSASSSILFGCNIKKQLTVAYSYDFTLNQLSGYDSGSHEFIISYLLPFKKKKTTSEIVGEADETELNTIDNSMKTNLKNKKKAEKKEIEEKKKAEEKEKEKKEQEEKKPNPEEENTDEKKPDDGK